MTNSKANRSDGWSPGDDVTAKQLNQLARGIAGSLDGAAGGLHSPVKLLSIAPLKTSKFGDTTVNGTVSRSAAGRLPLLIDDSTLSDTASAQKLTVAKDVYWTEVGESQVWQIILISTGEESEQTPVVGDEITVSIIGAGNFDQTIAREEPATLVATFPAAYVNQLSGTPRWAKFRWNGTTWEVISASADVTIP